MRISRLICTAMFVSVFIWPASSAEPEDIQDSGFMKVGHDVVPVRHSDRQLVTGIDLDKVFSRYIPDYERYGRSPQDLGTLWRWSERRDQDHSKYLRRTVRVFRSHEAALSGASRYLLSIQAVLRCDPPNPNDPGFISWGEKTFVCDNVFVSLLLSDHYKSIPEWFQRDLRNGADGIYKGPEVQPPVILGDDFPDDMTLLKIDGKPTAQLRVISPDQRPVYTSISATPRGYIFSRIGQPGNASRPANVEWVAPGHVVVVDPGSATIVDLEAVAVNDLCVVSDYWTKKAVRIAPPQEVQPQE